MVAQIIFMSRPIDKGEAWTRVKDRREWSEWSAARTHVDGPGCMFGADPDSVGIPPNDYEALWHDVEDTEAVVAAAILAHRTGQPIRYPLDRVDIKLGTLPNIPALGEKGSGYQNKVGTLTPRPKRRSPDVLADLMKTAFGFDAREDDEPRERREEPPAPTHREEGGLRALGRDEPEFDEFLGNEVRRDLDRQAGDLIEKSAQAWSSCDCGTAHRSKRESYRHHGIVGYSRRQDINEAEDYSDKAQGRADEEQDETPRHDATADYIVQLVSLALDGEFVVRHHLNGVPIRQIARDEAIPKTTLDRRIKAVLADLREMAVIQEMEARRGAWARRRRKDRHDGYGCPCGEILPTSTWAIVHAEVHQRVDRSHRVVGRRYRRADWRMGQELVLSEGGMRRHPSLLLRLHPRRTAFVLPIFDCPWLPVHQSDVDAPYDPTRCYVHLRLDPPPRLGVEPRDCGRQHPACRHENAPLACVRQAPGDCGRRSSWWSSSTPSPEGFLL